MRGLSGLSVFGAALLVAAAAGCGARTGLSLAQPQADGGAGDAQNEEMPDTGQPTGPDATIDAMPEGDATADTAPVESAAPCDFGTVVSDVFGSVVQFNFGNPVPPGRYRITYVDGCMKYSSSQGWTVNAYAAGDPSGTDRYWLVGPGMTELVVPPGTVGFLIGSGGFADFDACVTANLSLPPIDFDFTGGVIGVWLDDDPYSDNVAGLNGRSPTWRLTLPECAQ
jgi:hypothetical protein